MNEAAEDMLEEGMGHGVQQASSGQHEVQEGHSESEVKNKLLDDLENIQDIMSVNMGDLGSVLVISFGHFSSLDQFIFLVSLDLVSG